MQSATPSYPWYSIISGKGIEQGDILPDTPRLILPPGPVEGSIDATTELTHAIVMSQSCDLVAKKIEDLIFCPVVYRSQVVGSAPYNKPEFWESVRQGKRYKLHLLNDCQIEGFEFDFVLVDLSQVFSLPFVVVEDHALRLGDRVRLLPPYREQLAQSFARFYMRVGLPIDIPKFK